MMSLLTIEVVRRTYEDFT